MTRTPHMNALMLAALVAAAAATAGCNRDDPAPTARQSTTGTTSVDPLTDARISTAVQAKYYSDDRMRARHIDVETTNGTVTLRGSVPDESTKQHALMLTRSVEGVAGVNDEIQVRAAPASTSLDAVTPNAGEVGTTGRDDERQPGWITTKIQAQYFINPALSPWNIDVTTGSGGVVILEGRVDSAAAKTEAVRIARETDGVIRVDDRVKVTADGDRLTPHDIGIDAPDPWLTAKIQAKYFLDGDVKGRRIDVDTRNGVVTLTGSVESEMVKRQAVALARNTEGVREVKDALRVDPLLRDRGATESARDPKQPVAERVERPDIWITTKIQSKFFLDPDVKGHQINVDTNQGVVTLKGHVDTAAQKQEAEQIARETDGVSRVVNELTIGARDT